MIVGVVKFKTVMLNAPTIIKFFGLKVFLKCVVAGISKKKVTFLEIISKD